MHFLFLLVCRKLISCRGIFPAPITRVCKSVVVLSHIDATYVPVLEKGPTERLPSAPVAQES